MNSIMISIMSIGIDPKEVFEEGLFRNGFEVVAKSMDSPFIIVGKPLPPPRKT